MEEKEIVDNTVKNNERKARSAHILASVTKIGSLTKITEQIAIDTLESLKNSTEQSAHILTSLGDKTRDATTGSPSGSAKKTRFKFSTFAITCLAVIKFKRFLKSYSLPPLAYPPKWGIVIKPEIEESSLYTREGDIEDMLIVKVPKKYVNEYEIAFKDINPITNFLHQIKDIREKNFSLREVTLNRLNILCIKKEHGDGDGEGWVEYIDLFLNLGLNPYIDFNDYYIKSVNCVNIKSSILVFKRYVRFNPYNNNNLYMHYPMNLNIMFRDITEKGQNIMKDYCIIKGRLHEKAKLNICNFYLEEIMNEKDIWTDIEEKQYMYKYKLTKKYAIDRKIVREKLDDNLNIWKFGPSLFNNNNDTKEFEWFRHKNGVKTHEYELVKIFKKISNFEQILIPEGYYDDIDELEIIQNNERDKIKRILREKMEREDCYLSFYKIEYNENREKLLEKMKLLKGTSVCTDKFYTHEENISKVDGNNKLINHKSRLTEVLLNYIADIQEYIFEGNDNKIRRYIHKDVLFPTLYNNAELYQDLLNDNLFKIIFDGLKIYEKEVIDNDLFELQTPDIYILLGFNVFPSKFSREYWDDLGFSDKLKWRWIIKSQSFLEGSGWYYMYGLCCFFAQIIGPSYYLYNYYLIDNNEYCPNNSSTLNKFFAIAYYLVLYARMNSFWRSLTTVTWQYCNTTLITNDNYIRLTLIINAICLCIIPLFTYTLFIELSSITDLILNCLTGEFLINIDNLIIEFIGEEDYIKLITKDLLIFSFVDKGFPKKNIMDGDTTELWIVSGLQVIQMIGTLMMTGIVYKCI